MCGAFYPNYFEQVRSDDEATADRDISGYNPSTTVMVCIPCTLYNSLFLSIVTHHLSL